jgi:eukaryotic-like serine/threonine-protein kinase
MQTQTQRFLQGESVDGKFQIGQYLGGSDHSAVFRTQYGDIRPKEAAIKLVPAPAGAAEAQLSRWRLAANFSHPHLVQILQMGRCEVDNAAMLYVLTELASENLAEIIPERPLTPDETRELLRHVVDALGFIHSRGFVHGHIKPANIMAVGEELKLSSDGICRLGEDIENTGPASAYDPPEGASNGASPAADMWSLGVTLVEILTQQLPAWNPSDRKDPALPETLPAPFVDIVCHCLRRDPKNRWSAAAVAAHLPRAASPRPTPAPRDTPEPVEVSRHEETASFPRRYVVGGAGLAIVLAVILAGSKLIGRHPAGQAAPETSANPTPSSEPRQIDAKPAQAQPARGQSAQSQPTPAQIKPSHAVLTVPRRAEAPTRSIAPTPVRAEPRQEAAQEIPPAASPQATAKPAPTLSASNAPAPSSSAQSPRGRVVHQVLPDVPKRASDTIWGTVRVGVRVNVDSSGKVTTAQLDSTGPSRYFAALSLDAARKWEFAPPSMNGGPIASTWLLHFNYTNSGTSVVPSQTQP